MSKYTKERLEPVIRESLSFAEVIRKLGLKQTGGTQTHIKARTIALDINFQHFLGKARNKGGQTPSGFKKRSWQEYLVNGRKIHAYLLRRALVESGRKYKCEECQNTGTWNDKKLVLQVDHKNGDNRDNQTYNLRFLCPNCHSQTDNWSGKRRHE